MPLALASVLGTAIAGSAEAAPTSTTSTTSSTASTASRAAVPHPVAPSVHRRALAGVDAAALAVAPAAFDPVAVRQADLAAARTAPSAETALPEVTTRAPATRRPALFTAPLDTGRFTAAGVTWSAAGAPADVTAQVRIRENGAWQDWQVLDPAAGPDPSGHEGRAAAGRVSTEPVSTGGADAVQVRLDSPTGAVPRDVSLVTVDPGVSAADSALGTPSLASPSAVTSPVAQPLVYSRAQWGADESLLAINAPCPGDADTVKVAFVHHTVGSNTYTADQSASVIRGIYAYHVQGNGWCDIGYNVLVDRFGRIFEGRHGGIAAPVIGAHTLAFNYQSFGVAAMGTFSSVAAPAAMTDGIYSVIGWKLGLYGRDPLGSGVLRSAGGPGAKYPEGTNVSFASVSGHRDGYATECPGNVLYSQLPAIRTAASVYLQQHRVPATPVPTTLPTGASSTSPDGRYRLVLQSDGNLVVYAGSVARWSSSTFFPGSTLRLQSDGNLVIYSAAGVPLWSPLVSSPGSQLLLQDDGGLVLYSAQGAPLWDSRGTVGRAYDLSPNARVPSLAAGASVTSASGVYTLVMQRDGNLVLYRAGGSAVWNARTTGRGDHLAAQSDGNLVVYPRSGAAVWDAGVSSAGARPLLQNDGRLVIYSAAGPALWSSAR